LLSDNNIVTLIDFLPPYILNLSTYTSIEKNIEFLSEFKDRLLWRVYWQRKLRLTLFNTTHFLQSILSDDKGYTTPALLKLAGKTLALRNIDILNTLYNVESIRIPDKFSKLASLIEDNFPSISIEVFNDEKYNFALRTNTDTSGSLIDSKGDIIENNITINRETKEKSSIQFTFWIQCYGAQKKTGACMLVWLFIHGAFLMY
jgi:hypothetical protein